MFWISPRRAFTGAALAALAFFTSPAHALPDAQVLLSITANTPTMPAFDRVTVTRQPTGSQSSGSAYELTPLLRGVSTDTLVYGRSLPAGEYEITALRQTVMEKILPLNEVSRKTLGRFVVADGQSVDLGRLVVTSVNNRMMVGRSRLVDDNPALLQQHEPGRWAEFLAASKGQAPVRGWVTPPLDDDDVERYATARPAGFQRPTEGADGRVVAASRMGAVLVRSRSGTWTVLRSPRIETLAHAVPVDLPDTALVAVGELGLILRQPTSSPVLQVVDPGDLPRGNLRFIAHALTTGWVVAVQQGHKLRFMVSKQLAAGRWTLLREVDASPLLRDRGSQVWLWATPGGLGVAVPRGPIATLDFASGRWTEQRTPQGHPLLDFVAGPHGAMTAVTYSASGLAGEHALHFRSLDSGATWERVASVPVRGKQFPDALTPLLDGSLVIEGGEVRAPVLHASTDGGTTWQTRKLLRIGVRLYPLPSGLLLAQGINGWLDVDATRDDGLSWKNEFTTFDLAAYKAQEAREAQHKKP